MQLIAVISSMSFESALILSCLKNTRSYDIAGKTVHKGKFSGLNIVLMDSGMGKVNAAHAASHILEKYSAGAVISIGVGGAYPASGLNIGDIAIASKEIYGDDGVIGPGGWRSLKEIGIPLVRAGKKKYFNEYPLALPSRSCFKRENRVEAWDFEAKSGNFVTVSAVTGTRKRATELEKRFNALCENMEGAAIAQVCALYKVPMYEIRGISNITGTRDKRKWDLILASGNCQKAVLKFISSMG